MANNLKTAHFQRMILILRSNFFFNLLSDCLFTFLVVDHFWKNSLSEHISCARSPQNLTRSEEDLFGKKPLPILISMTMFFLAKMADGIVDAETEFHKDTLWQAKMLAVRGKSKFITVIILNIFLQDEESILVH